MGNGRSSGLIFPTIILLLGEMELKLRVGFCLILCFFLFQESAGFVLPSLSSLFLPIEVKTPVFKHYTGKQRFVLLQNDLALSPTSTHTSSGHKQHGTPAEAPHLKALHSQSPSYHPSIRASNHHKSSISSDAHAPAPAPAPTPSPSQPIKKKKHHFGKKVHHFASEPYHHLQVPSPSPSISPLSSSLENDKKTLPPLPSLILPPPPPNHGCVSVTCSEPLTYTPPGATCGCVWPIEVRLRFSTSLYTFFPLVSELAEEISADIPLDRSQVRIMGADAADQEKTTVLINLVPLYQKFNTATAFSIYTKFWKREVSIKSSFFGAYDVLYVRYPGLPSSPPSRSSGSATVDVQPYPGSRNDDGPIKPLGVDVPKRRNTNSGKNMIIVIVLSSVTAFVVCMGCILIFLSKSGCCVFPYRQTPQDLTYSDGKTSGGGRLLTLRSRPSSGSMSFSSSLLACTGNAKVFSIDDIERATNNFSTSRIIGEGGFGLVFGGILDDGREVAVKVLKRDDQQGSREFLAEVEMLRRLHHRNLVKLIGICAEDQCRCLVYNLVPNGSVESHLHGADKEVAPLDWFARMKIALGAARGLAYLHEDSSPRVIHRDFKSSNILLENDFTPKVSDFGLARTAMDDGNKHISTHVMGTFGYLAPEYAMTGHLLVKSDVYSYGVVLLELLTGRKPVDLSQPPGQENLVAWARPLLAAKEGLEIIIDPTLKSTVPLENIAKVAAIASMCVQPEVSHRPFMGEVVQALKLVCNEFDETKEPISRTCSQEEFSVDIVSKRSRISNEFVDALEKYDSTFDSKIALSAVDLKSASAGFEGMESESFRRQFNSAPLKMGRKRKFWQRLKGMSRGSMSEHEFSSNL